MTPIDNADDLINSLMKHIEDLMETNYKQVAQLLAWLSTGRYGSLIDRDELITKIDEIFQLNAPKEKTDDSIESLDVIHANDPDDI